MKWNNSKQNKLTYSKTYLNREKSILPWYIIPTKRILNIRIQFYYYISIYI